MLRITFACLFAGVLISPHCTAEKLVRPDFRSKLFAPNERGERLYSIWFDAAFVESLGPQGEPAPRSFYDPENARDFRASPSWAAYYEVEVFGN